MFLSEAAFNRVLPVLRFSVSKPSQAERRVGFQTGCQSHSQQAHVSACLHKQGLFDKQTLPNAVCTCFDACWQYLAIPGKPGRRQLLHKGSSKKLGGRSWGKKRGSGDASILREWESGEASNSILQTSSISIQPQTENESEVRTPDILRLHTLQSRFLPLQLIVDYKSNGISAWYAPCVEAWTGSTWTWTSILLEQSIETLFLYQARVAEGFWGHCGFCSARCKFKGRAMKYWNIPERDKNMKIHI